MQIHQVKRKRPNQKPKRVGRGGKRGKTAGRGTKGQGARAGRKFRPELRDKIKKLPKLRGRGSSSFKSRLDKPKVVTLLSLSRIFPNGGEINPTVLLEKRLISRENGKLPEVKILGSTSVNAKYTVTLTQMSKVAREAIEKAGGTVNVRASSVEPTPRAKKVARIEKKITAKAKKIEKSESNNTATS